MCLAIVKPGKTTIPEEHLHAGWIHNPDGGGFAYVKDGKVVIEKGFKIYQGFLEAYRKAAAANPNSPFLIHFRIASLGDRSSDNTHPFRISNGALIHNGTMTGTGAEYNRGKSDTCLFSEKFKDVLTFELVQPHKTKWDQALGHSKVCLLFDDGRYTIINEILGHWDLDIWYSNRSYVPTPRGQSIYAGYSEADIEEWDKYGGRIIN